MNLKIWGKKFTKTPFATIAARVLKVLYCVNCKHHTEPRIKSLTVKAIILQD